MQHLYSQLKPGRRWWPALSFGLLLLATTARAQLSGTYYVTATTGSSPDPTKEYASLPAAMTALGTNGVATGSSVRFVLLDATYALGATTLTIPAPTLSTGQGISLVPGTVVSPVITSSVASPSGAIVLDGTDYLTINGNNGSGGKAITIRNTGTGPTVLLQNDATNNNLRYLTLESAVTGVGMSGSTPTTPTAGTVQFSALTGTTGNNDNLVEYCDVRAANNSASSVPTGAIYAVGTTSVTNNRVTVQNCNIYNFSAGGIYLDNTGGNAWIIQNNNLYQTATRSTQVRAMRVATGSFSVQNNNVYQTAGTQGTPFYGIAVANGASGTISGNYVGGSAPGATGTPMSFTGTSLVNGIYLLVSGTAATSVQNNVVRGLSSAATNLVAAIDVQQGSAASIGNATANQLGGTGSGQGISGVAAVYGVFLEGTGANTVQNNTVAGLSSSGGTVAGVYLSSTGAATVSGNTIGSLSSSASSGNLAGVLVLSTLGAVVANSATLSTNQITGLTASAGAAVSGVYVGSSGAPTISGNVIGTLSSTSTSTAATVAGLYLNLTGSTAPAVSGNQATGLSAVGGSPVYGIYLPGAAATTLSGNTLSNLSSNLTTAAPLLGIGTAAATGAVAISNNTLGTLSQTGLSTGLYGIQANLVAGSGVTGNTVNGVTYAGSSTGQTVAGIAAGGSNQVSTNQVSNVAVTSGSINNLLGIGVGGAAGATPTVTGNTVSGVRSAATGGAFTLYGLAVGTGAVLGAATVSTNLISDVGTSSTAANTGQALVVGLLCGAATGATTERNRIWNVYGSSTATGSNADRVRGLLVQGSYSGTFANNQISLPGGSTTQFTTGLRDESSNGSNNYYYNSVYLAPASGPATSDSYGFYRSANPGTATATNPPPVSLLNNVLLNGRTASGATAGAIGTASTSNWPASTSNYNLLISPGTGTVGNFGGPNYTFAGWKTATGGDASSLSETSANVPAGNLFGNAAAGNLDVNPANAEAWYVNGNGVQVSGQTADNGSASAGRSTTVAGGGTDIGADELTPTSTPPALAASPAAPSPGGTQTFTLGGRTLARLAWGSTGTVPTAVTARYYSGTNPPAPYAAGARVANYYFDFGDGGTGSNYAYQPTLTYDPALLGAVASESDQQLALRDADNSGYRPLPTTVNPAATARTLALAGGGSLSRLGTLAVGDQATPLPVTLAAFNAFRTGPDAELNWNSATEYNNWGYEVQVSGDGLAYRALGFVASAAPNSATARFYQFVDREAGKQGVRYYRLRQVDLDGRSAYSPVRAVAFDGLAATPALQASPNPFAGAELALTLTLAQPTAATLTVTDATGRPVLTRALTAPAGASPVALPELAGLPAGLYLVQVQTGLTSLTLRIVKQ